LAQWTHSKEDEKDAIHSAARELARLVPESAQPPTDCKTISVTAPAPAPEPAPDPSPSTEAEQPRTADGQQTGTPPVSDVVEAANALVDALRRWYERADDWTWVWLRGQAWCFICGGVLLAGPVIYYVFDHGAK
jgi:hypothetical protein